jgi:SAM-dependent methyltransferase
MGNNGWNFDRAYRDTDHYFGERPERILVDFAALIDQSRPALDVGAGQGRNSFYLARLCAGVDAIDPSQEAVKTISTVAQKTGLPVRAVQTDFEGFDPVLDGIAGEKFRSYGAICLLGLIQLLTPVSVQRLKENLLLWSGEGTLIFVTAFTTDDPSFEEISRTWNPAGPRSFMDNTGAVRTFLEPGEARHLLGEFSVVFHREGLGPEHRHGEGPLQRHAIVEAVLKRERD